MRWLLGIVALLTAGGGLYVAAAGASGPSPARAPRGELTRPRVRPKLGGPHTDFTLWFTLRETPGHTGVVATDYEVRVAPTARRASRCWPAPPPPVQTGRKGERIRIRLPRPSAGWCAGHYAVTVYLQRGPYCPRPVNGQPPTPCPEFATQNLDVGDASFVVR